MHLDKLRSMLRPRNWKQKNASLHVDCEVFGIDNDDKLSAMLPVVKDLPMTLWDSQGTCREFAQKVRDRTYGKTFQDCLLHWAAAALDRHGDEQLKEFVSVDLPCLVAEIEEKRGGFAVGRKLFTWLRRSLLGSFAVRPEAYFVALLTATEETWWDRAADLKGPPLGRVVARVLRHLFEFAWNEGSLGRSSAEAETLYRWCRGQTVRARCPLQTHLPVPAASLARKQPPDTVRRDAVRSHAQSLAGKKRQRSATASTS